MFGVTFEYYLGGLRSIWSYKRLTQEKIKKKGRPVKDPVHQPVHLPKPSGGDPALSQRRPVLTFRVN